MVKVQVVQTDNRPSLNYLLKTQEINKKFCDILGYNYLFIHLDNSQYGKIHPAIKKIHVINDFLNNDQCDILVFLDSDAWIQNGYWLNDIINNLANNPEKNGCFSRDPYVKKNTYINSGSFIIKNNEYIKNMYNILINKLYENTRYHNCWPYDQYYISNYIYEYKEAFIIFVPDILNTPFGKVLRHNWLKNKRMYNDLTQLNADIDRLLIVNSNFELTEYLDNKPFPNINVYGYEYFEPEKV